MDHKKLVEEAIKGREKSYSPYSKFKVGAAVLTKNGTVFRGCNVENASYGLTNCAERTALFKMVSEGEREVAAIAIVADTGDDVCAPCGACRQVIYEFGDDIDVIMANLKGKMQVVKSSEILNFAFGPKSLGIDVTKA